MFVAGLANVEVELHVDDRGTGQVWTHLSPLHTTLETALDTDALATCP